MWGELIAWFSSALSALSGFLKLSSQWILSKLYLLILPFVAVLKLVFDFCRSAIDQVVDLINSLGAGFSTEALSVPDSVQFVNSFFPIDEIFLSAISLFTFFVGCQLIATIRGIKQTLLF